MLLLRSAGAGAMRRDRVALHCWSCAIICLVLPNSSCLYQSVHKHDVAQALHTHSRQAAGTMQTALTPHAHAPQLRHGHSHYASPPIPPLPNTSRCTLPRARWQ